MGVKKRHWIWNMLIGVTLVVCAIAFVAHYKNWIRTGEGRIEILSGIYYQEVPFLSLNSVQMVDKIPRMERISGFSAWMKEKGIFRDSLYPDSKVYVYVDELSHPKIKVVHHDSLVLFLNLSDSLQTLEMFEFLTSKKELAQTVKTDNQ